MFEGQPNNTGEMVSPGGFSFGVQGWAWGEPRPLSITFFMDGSAMVCDQYGRPIRTVVTEDGRILRFADCPPTASREGTITPRPQFANHQEVLSALALEHIDWLSYTVKYRQGDGTAKSRSGLTKEAAEKLFNQLVKEAECAASNKSHDCLLWLATVAI